MLHIWRNKKNGVGVGGVWVNKFKDISNYCSWFFTYCGQADKWVCCIILASKEDTIWEIFEWVGSKYIEMALKELLFIVIVWVILPCGLLNILCHID
jgi:hypothetical protein